MAIVSAQSIHDKGICKTFFQTCWRGEKYHKRPLNCTFGCFFLYLCSSVQNSQSSFLFCEFLAISVGWLIQLCDSVIVYHVLQHDIVILLNRQLYDRAVATTIPAAADAPNRVSEAVAHAFVCVSNDSTCVLVAERTASVEFASQLAPARANRRGRRASR